MVKLFEQFDREDLAGQYINEKMGLPAAAKEAADEIAKMTEDDLKIKDHYIEGFKTSYAYTFSDQHLIDEFGADGIQLTLEINVGPTLFKKDMYSEANVYDAPQKTTSGSKIVFVNLSMWMDMDCMEDHFERGVQSAMTELKSVLYHELTHSNEFERRKKNGAFVSTSTDRSTLKGSMDLQQIITKASHTDIPYFFTRFFQLMYIATSYETNAFAAMIVADMEKHTFKKREDFDSLKDYITSQHDTLEKRKLELITTNSWRNYIKLKEFSMGDFLKQLENYGLTFDKFFKALTRSSSEAAEGVLLKSIQENPNIDNKERPAMIKSMKDTIALLKNEKSKDPIDQMRAVAKKIADAKERLGKKLMRMVTYE